MALQAGEEGHHRRVVVEVVAPMHRQVVEAEALFVSRSCHIKTKFTAMERIYEPIKEPNLIDLLNFYHTRDS